MLKLNIRLIRGEIMKKKDYISVYIITFLVVIIMFGIRSTVRSSFDFIELIYDLVIGGIAVSIFLIYKIKTHN